MYKCVECGWESAAITGRNCVSCGTYLKPDAIDVQQCEQGIRIKPDEVTQKNHDMCQSIARTRTGLRMLKNGSYALPDYLLYVGPKANNIPNSIWDIPVICTVIPLNHIDLGTAVNVNFLPCYAASIVFKLNDIYAFVAGYEGHYEE